MKLRPHRYPQLLAAGAFALWCCLASAQDAATPREQELLDLVRQLQERIESMDERIKEIEAKGAVSQTSDLQAEVNEEIEERVEKIEGSLTEIQEREQGDFRAYWRNGLYFETADRKYTLQIGGRAQLDAAFFEQDENLSLMFGEEQDSVEFRRLRLYFKGELLDRMAYKVQVDFAGGSVALNDVYIEFKPRGARPGVRIGHFKEPMGLEQLASSLDHPFMERSLINALVPGRNVGLMLHSQVLDKRLTWALGIFRDTDTTGFGMQDGRYNATARITGLPLYKNEGRRLIHLGASTSFRNPEYLYFETRPESHLTDTFFLDTGIYPVNNAWIHSGEAALVYGPFSFQAEYMRASTDTNIILVGNQDFAGLYAMASYFITGEHRPYSLSKATFGRLEPKRPFGNGDGGWGALELALRFSKLDLSDGLIGGGEEENWTVGINWYLNANMRFMWNYVHADIHEYNGLDGTLDILQTRFQVRF